MRTIEEPMRGAASWKLVILKEGDLVKVAIQRPRGGDEAWIHISEKDLLDAVLSELEPDMERVINILRK